MAVDTHGQWIPTYFRSPDRHRGQSGLSQGTHTAADTARRSEAPRPERSAADTRDQRRRDHGRKSIIKAKVSKAVCTALCINTKQTVGMYGYGITYILRPYVLSCVSGCGRCARSNAQGRRSRQPTSQEAVEKYKAKTARRPASKSTPTII